MASNLEKRERERVTQPLIKLWFLENFEFFIIVFIYRPFLIKKKRFLENVST